MDFADSDVVFDSEVMVELDNIATTRGSVARELIVEQDDENKIRAIVQQNVEEIKVSIQRHGIDKERIRLLVKGNSGSYELYDGNHRYRACAQLFDNTATKKYCQSLMKNDTLEFPVLVMPQETPTHIAKLFALRSNLLNASSSSMSWQDYLSVMICFPKDQLDDPKFKSKYWKQSTGYDLEKTYFARTRKRAQWIVDHNVIDLWCMLTQRQVNQRCFDAVTKLDPNLEPHLYEICLIAASRNENVLNVAEKFKQYTGDNLLASLKEWLITDDKSPVEEPNSDEVPSETTIDHAEEKQENELDFVESGSRASLIVPQTPPMAKPHRCRPEKGDRWAMDADVGDVSGVSRSSVGVVQQKRKKKVLKMNSLLDGQDGDCANALMQIAKQKRKRATVPNYADNSAEFCTCINDTPAESCCCEGADYQVECSVIHHGKKYCSNQVIQKAVWPALKKKKTPSMGYGLFADTDIKANTIIGVYDGEAIDRAERDKRESKGNVYIMQVDGDHFVDGETGGMMKFINHSFTPNCKAVQWDSKGKKYCAITTLQDISSGDQLFYDYGNAYYPEVVIENGNACVNPDAAEVIKNAIRRAMHPMHVMKVDVSLKFHR